MLKIGTFTLSVEGVAEMAAMGFGLDRTTFREAGKYGCGRFFFAALFISLLTADA